jgi:2,4-dienoyl-CoA reductase-like NADH-dependent reductase (Old Yellow Enzyme family)
MNHPHLLSVPESLPIKGLKNRVVMSAMTRSFATTNHLCTSDIAAYYERRAEAGVGLILTEGIIVHPSGDGYNTVTHLHNETQADSWRQAVDAVHRHGTKIYAQLWHCGRISHPDYTSGFDVVSSTDKPASGVNRQNGEPFGTPRALRADEMAAIYGMFCHSVDLAFHAGFDGVELHMGHGYLVDQFLDARVNDRTDAYGGSVDGRCRFALELLSAVVARFGTDRVMVRISPSRMMGGLYEWPDLDDMLDTLITGFLKLGLVQLDVSCANADYFQTSGKVIRLIRARWPHLIVGGASLSIDAAEREISEGHVDLVTWGRALLANPDFVRRVAKGEQLRPFEESMRSSLI